MDDLFSFLLLCHITIGTIALVLFWFPAFSKKGSARHKKFGVWYTYMMQGVVLSAFIMAVLAIFVPELVKPNKFESVADAQAVRSSIVGFAILLLYLSLLTFVSLHYGQLVLQAKRNREILRTPFHIAITLCLLIGGLLILYKGILDEHILMLIFGPLGMFIALTNLYFTYKPVAGSQDWLVEHLGAYITSGIGAYTAFISFGGRQLFEASGMLQLSMWTAPGVIGTIFILFLSRKYSN